MTPAEYFGRWIPWLLAIGALLMAPVYVLLWLIWKRM